LVGQRYDFAVKSRDIAHSLRPVFENIPCIFPVSREFGPQTGSPVTVSSATHSYNLRLGAVSEDSAVFSEAWQPARRLRDAL
jgi:hypothetical protein